VATSDQHKTKTHLANKAISRNKAGALLLFRVPGFAAAAVSRYVLF
jgi:hypothetical protein